MNHEVKLSLFIMHFYIQDWIYIVGQFFFNRVKRRIQAKLQGGLSECWRKKKFQRLNKTGAQLLRTPTVAHKTNLA